MQACDFVPNFAVCLQEFIRIDSAQACVGCKGLSADIQYLFVKCFEGGEVRPVAECDGIAKNLLCACEPCGAEMRAVDADLWGLIKECGADQLRLCAERACSARLNYVLVLLLRHAKLPGYPLDCAFCGEPLVH